MLKQNSEGGGIKGKFTNSSKGSSVNKVCRLMDQTTEKKTWIMYAKESIHRLWQNLRPSGRVPVMMIFKSVSKIGLSCHVFLGVHFGQVVQETIYFERRCLDYEPFIFRFKLWFLTGNSMLMSMPNDDKVFSLLQRSPFIKTMWWQIWRKMYRTRNRTTRDGYSASR